MIHLLVLFSALVASTTPAFAAKAKTSCEKFVADLPAGLPSPFEVDLEDDRAILSFINEVTPFPPSRSPHALEVGLKAFWARYVPKLTERDIHHRVMAHSPTTMALSHLQGSAHPTKRAEIGRLRLIWMAILKDLSPTTTFDPAVVHRARVLALTQKSHDILGFLEQTIAPEIHLDDDSYPRAMRTLYQTYLPGHDVPDLKLTEVTRRPRQRQVVDIWSAYVEMFTPQGKISPLGAKPGDEYQIDPTADPATLPDDPRLMVKYLIQRYRKIDQHAPRAIWMYIAALRKDYGLGDTLIDINASAVATILRHRATFPSEQMRVIWAEFLRDRAAKTKAG